MAAPAPQFDYPWYSVVEGDDIAQGDILNGCPVFAPPEELAELDITDGEIKVPFDCDLPDVVVLTQSCDLQKGREKVHEVLLCTVWEQSDFKEGTFSRPDDWENARKGRMPTYHILNRCDLPQFERGARVVDFRRVYSLPASFVRKQAAKVRRVRLMPPYREHLSQAFARFIMRVGLPADIPPFK